jgi:hypothetical protein
MGLLGLVGGEEMGRWGKANLEIGQENSQH